MSVRRRRHGRKSRVSGDEGVLPLINVVFMLLVFFLLAGTLTSAEMLEIDPTASRSQADPRDQDFVILIGAGGELAVGDALVSADTLAGLLPARIAEAPATPVWIKADAGAAAQSSYFATLNAHLARFKQYPSLARQRDQQGVAMLYFAIDAAGRVTAARIERTSGYEPLDEAALEMVWRAQPLPPILAGLGRSSLALVVPVQFSLY